ncbi:hypothetical protein ACS0TY_012856 [Phlomoides rotata]
MVGGDFNIFLHLDERIGSDVDRTGEMVDFAEAVADCELVDAGCVGSPFTWHRRELFQRLDRILYTEPWLSIFPVSTVTHLPGDPSDHSQLLFQCKFSVVVPRSSFRFQSMWTRHHTFLDQVRMAWDVNTGEFGMLNLQLKLGAVKRRLKWWNRHIFGDIFHKVKAASNAVVHAEAAYLADPSSVLLMDLNQRRAEFILRTRMEEDFWRQKSAVRWVVEGERNTRFFQSLVKQKRVQTRIHSIHADGRTISDENELRASAASFFQHHLSNDMIFDADICRDHFSVLPPSTEWAPLVQQLTGFQLGSLPFVYLGIPLYKGARWKALFARLCDRMRSMVQGWSHRHLCHGGRLALIRSTLATLPLYYLQVLQPTAEIFHELEQIMARFFWGSRDGQRKRHWFVWHDMCVPVDEGGIGIRRLWGMFVAYSMKMYWRFRLQSSLWARFLRQKYCSVAFPGQRRLPTFASHQWQRLIEYGLVAQSHIFWSVGSGDQCCLWFDTWLGDRPLVEIMDFLSPPAWSPMGRLYIRDGQWDLLSVRYMVQDCGYSEELVQDIISVPLRSSGGDVMRWKLTSHGEFSLTSAWESVRGRGTHRDLYGAIWSNYLFPTTSFFLRRLLTGHIPVDTRLYSWGTAIPSKCHCCIDFPQVETVTHLFLLNPVVRSYLDSMHSLLCFSVFPV